MNSILRSSSFTLLICLATIVGCSSPPPPQAYQPSERLGDEDRDGIINSKDNCPGTILGRTIDNNGCDPSLADKSRVEIVAIFDENSVELSLVQQEALANSLEEVTPGDIDSIFLESHSSSRELQAHPLLNEQRILTIKDFLTSFNITAPIGAISSGSASSKHETQLQPHGQLNQRVYIIVFTTSTK